MIEGKITDQTYEEWNRETGGRKLPERIGAGRYGVAKAPERRTAKKT